MIPVLFSQLLPVRKSIFHLNAIDFEFDTFFTIQTFLPDGFNFCLMVLTFIPDGCPEFTKLADVNLLVSILVSLQVTKFFFNGNVDLIQSPMVTTIMIL